MTLPTTAAATAPGAAASPVVRAAAAATCLAALVHLAVLQSHLTWWPAAGFFTAVAVGQLALAVCLLRGPGPRTLWAGIVATCAVVAVYVVSRTAGLPFVPDAHGSQPVPGARGNGRPVLPGQSGPGVEDVGALDLTALAAELVLVALLVALLPPRARAVAVNALFAVGAGAWTLWALGAVV